jgi:hypothetical protein
MQIRERVIQGVEAILAERGPGGKFAMSDMPKIMTLAAYDAQGHVNEEGLQTLVYVGQQYQSRMPLLFSLLFQQLVNSVPGNPVVYVPDGGESPPAQPASQKPQSRPSSQPARTQPRPAAAPAADHDRRLVGAWEYSTYYSAGGYSSSHSEVRVLRADGHFVESSDSYINVTEHDSCGDETSSTALSNTPEDQRGTWSTAGNRLKLVWDNHYYAVYEFSVGSDGMSLTPIDPAGGKETYWARME